LLGHLDLGADRDLASRIILGRRRRIRCGCVRIVCRSVVAVGENCATTDCESSHGGQTSYTKTSTCHPGGPTQKYVIGAQERTRKGHTEGENENSGHCKMRSDGCSAQFAKITASANDRTRRSRG